MYASFQYIFLWFSIFRILYTHNHTTCLCLLAHWVQVLQSALLVAQVAMQMSSERLSVPPIWWVTKGTQEPWVATAWNVSSDHPTSPDAEFCSFFAALLRYLESMPSARTRSLAAMCTLACGARSRTFRMEERNVQLRFYFALT